MTPVPETRLRSVTSAQNSLVKELRKAFSRSEPSGDGSVAIEGIRLVEEAIRSGLRLRAVFFSESARAYADRLLPQIAAQAETLLLPDKVFSSAVATETPQGVAALVKVKSWDPQDLLDQMEGMLLVGVAGVQDPGNLGTIIRSAEAFGARAVLVGEKTVSHTNPKTIRASAGSLFRLPLLRVKLSEVLPDLKSRQVRVVASSSHKGKPVQKADLTGPLVLLVGNEGAGIPAELLRQADELVTIAHSERVESLNAGIAASVLLYEAMRQRQEATR